MKIVETKRSVIIVGGFHEVIELCELNGLIIEGIIDNSKRNSYNGYKIIGSDDDAKKLFKTFGKLPLLISLDSPERRKSIAQSYNSIGYHFISLISSNSFVSRTAYFGTGVVVQSRSNISSCVEIGDFARINTMANIMHDTKIGQFATIAPNAVILGNVKVGDLCYIGANSTILPGISIGDKSVIGAGAVVTKDVGEDKIMVGNPARELVRRH